MIRIQKLMNSSQPEMVEYGYTWLNMAIPCWNFGNGTYSTLQAELKEWMAQTDESIDEQCTNLNGIGSSVFWRLQTLKCWDWWKSIEITWSHILANAKTSFFILVISLSFDWGKTRRSAFGPGCPASAKQVAIKGQFCPGRWWCVGGALIVRVCCVLVNLHKKGVYHQHERIEVSDSLWPCKLKLIQAYSGRVRQFPSFPGWGVNMWIVLGSGSWTYKQQDMDQTTFYQHIRLLFTGSYIFQNALVLAQAFAQIHVNSFRTEPRSPANLHQLLLQRPQWLGDLGCFQLGKTLSPRVTLSYFSWSSHKCSENGVMYLWLRNFKKIMENIGNPSIRNNGPPSISSQEFLAQTGICILYLDELLVVLWTEVVHIVSTVQKRLTMSDVNGSTWYVFARRTSQPKSGPCKAWKVYHFWLVLWPRPLPENRMEYANQSIVRTPFHVGRNLNPRKGSWCSSCVILFQQTQLAIFGIKHNEPTYALLIRLSVLATPSWIHIIGFEILWNV